MFIFLLIYVFLDRPLIFYFLFYLSLKPVAPELVPKQTGRKCQLFSPSCARAGVRLTTKSIDSLLITFIDKAL